MKFHFIIQDKTFYRKVLTIAVPIALQSLITIGVNLMDTIMLGSMGETQLSASSLANQFVQVFQIFCMGLGMGASVLIARFWGMRDRENLRKSITIMLRLTLALGTLFTLATIFFPRSILRIYTPDQGIIDAGRRYMRWIVACYYFQGLALTLTLVLRNVGLMRIPLYTSIGAFFVNIFFNWVFIFGKLGMPRMEIEGAALGTLISRAFEFGIIGGYFFLKDRKIGYRVRHIFMKCGDLVGDYIKISIPVLVSDGLLALGNNAVGMVFGRLGENFVSAQAITAVVQSCSTVVIQGVAQSAAIITGNTLGEGDVKKTQVQGEAFIGLGMALGLLAGGIILAIGHPVVNFYRLSEATNRIAYSLMGAQAFIVFFQATNNVMTKGVLRGGGDTRFLMVADILFLWVASIPLGALAGLVWHLPPFWTYCCIRIDNVIKAVWCIFRLMSGKWIKKVSHTETLKLEHG
ncbi:MAG: MATE family efflux transporter [Oscillospiraceae bacterium]|nr:MATE family efflux transporter [Oscillospiraceae bacterium]